MKGRKYVDRMDFAKRKAVLCWLKKRARRGRRGEKKLLAESQPLMCREHALGEKASTVSWRAGK